MNTGTSHEPGISLTYRRAFIHADQRRRIRGLGVGAVGESQATRLRPDNA